MREYAQETNIVGRFKTKKHARQWLQERFEDGFTVDAEPRKTGSDWCGTAHKLELIEEA